MLGGDFSFMEELKKHFVERRYHHFFVKSVCSLASMEYYNEELLIKALDRDAVSDVASIANGRIVHHLETFSREGIFLTVIPYRCLGRSATNRLGSTPSLCTSSVN